MVIAKQRRTRTRKSGTVLAAALALVMMPTPARTFVAPVLLPTSVLSQHLCTQRRAHQLQDTVRNLEATSGGIKVGDRVEILVKTVSFSKKLMANNLSSRDLTGVVKFVTSPEEPTDLAMATIEFRKVVYVCVFVCVCARVFHEHSRKTQFLQRLPLPISSTSRFIQELMYRRYITA